MKQIFLIAGKAQHGKDSTANFLKEKLPGKSVIIHQADYLKYIAQQYMGWQGNKDCEGRTLLQWLGTDRVRLELKKPTFWVEKTCDVIEILQDQVDYFLVPDCRFRNELYYTQARFPDYVKTIRVNRVSFDNGLTQEQKNHISETDLDNFDYDYWINSFSGLSFLEEEVKDFIWHYFQEK